MWDYNHEGYEHTVNTHINRLRTKLDKINSIENGGQLVETVWGVGYKLNVNGYIAKALIAWVLFSSPMPYQAWEFKINLN